MSEQQAMPAEQLRAAKLTLEVELQHVLQRFENEHGVQVDQVHIRRRTLTSTYDPPEDLIERVAVDLVL